MCLVRSNRAPSVARFFSAFIVSCDATHMMAIWSFSCVVPARSQRWGVAGISLYMAYLRWWLPAQIDNIRKTLYESPKQDDER
jgi:hypothetical protein